MIGKGKSISHGVAALEYDLAKEIDGQAAATEIARHELYGCTGAEMHPDRCCDQPRQQWWCIGECKG